MERKGERKRGSVKPSLIVCYPKIVRIICIIIRLLSLPV